MTYHIVIEPTAEREIRAAVRWKTENASPTVAVRWYNGLIKKIETLSRHPSHCPLAAENGTFPEDIRELLYGPRGKQKH
jgi:plasmid stabilization system protein ParE